jgi:hypothetical protein
MPPSHSRQRVSCIAAQHSPCTIFPKLPRYGKSSALCISPPLHALKRIRGLCTSPPVNHAVTIDLSEGSQKRPSNGGIAEKSKPNKKKRAPRKKVEVVELDDTKDDADLCKNTGHWKDHWVIQLVTVCGEMQNMFSAPPKQGKFFF